MKITTQIKNELIPIYKGMGLLCGITFIISLFFGFRLSFLSGIILGYSYVCWNLYYLGYTISNSVMKNQKHAKRNMRLSYALRLLVFAVLFAFSAFTPYISIVGVTLPLLYPKIVMGFNLFKGRR